MSRKAVDRHVGADCANYKGLKQIKSALEKFKINSVIKYPKNRDLFRLIIYGKDNLIKFQKEINFLHPKKKRKLQEAIDSYIDYNWDFSNKRKLLKKLIKGKSGKRIRICSVIKNNVVQLSQHLDKLKIDHKVYSEQNKHSKYFELCIHKKEAVKKLLKNKYTN